jgi:hypothetical protein
MKKVFIYAIIATFLIGCQDTFNKLFTKAVSKIADMFSKPIVDELNKGHERNIRHVDSIMKEHERNKQLTDTIKKENQVTEDNKIKCIGDGCNKPKQGQIIIKESK